MGLMHPELLLLALPAFAVWWHWRDARTWTNVNRFLVIAVLAAALAGPYMKAAAEGRDLIFVVVLFIVVPIELYVNMPMTADSPTQYIIRLPSTD